MTDDLNTLRPEVREAIERTDVTVEMFDTLVTVNRDDYDIIRAELLRPDREINDARIARADVHDWIERAERAETELAALKARIAEAPYGTLDSVDFVKHRATFDVQPDFVASAHIFALVKVEE